MKAGRLDRTITRLAHSVGAPNEYGNVVHGWAPAGEFRASVVRQSTEEFLRASGETAEAVVVFRLRFIPGFDVRDRIRFDGRDYEIKELTELGRREGLELRCEGVRG